MECLRRVTPIMSLFSRLTTLRESNQFCARFMVTRASTFGEPKRPLTSFMQFAQEKRPEVLRLYPSAKVSEVAKHMGGMWKSLPEIEKAKYKETSDDKMKVWKQEYEQYKKSLSKETLQELSAERKQRQVKKKARKMRHLRKLFNKPKKPPGSFFLFMNSGKVDRGDAPVTQFVQGLSSLWRKMTIEDKAPYVQESRERRVQYEMDLQQWEDQMKQEGHPELVRLRRLTRKRASPKRKQAKKSARKAKPSTPKKNTQSKPRKSTKKPKVRIDPNPTWMKEE